MKINFSLPYTPNDEYNEIGYHTTLLENKDSIIENGFLFSNGHNEWLGEGIYFWDNKVNATWWKKRNAKKGKKCIFVCELKCLSANYLDLDNKFNMRKFKEFSKKFLKSSVGKKQVKPKFKNYDQCRKFFCDIYCSHNDIYILSYTFDHDKMNQFGFKEETVKRRQICVRDSKYISIKSVEE